MISTDNRKYAFMKKLNFRKIDSDISTSAMRDSTDVQDDRTFLFRSFKSCPKH